jgi:hypothetical protein
MSNYNIDPYFDDHDPKKNYVKILFKPGVSVQARELTQIQTAIQQQIKSIGGFLFKNESLVSGGKSSFFTLTSVNVTATDVSDYVGKDFIASESKAKIKVIAVKNNVTPGVSKLYFSYKTGSRLQPADTLVQDTFAPEVPSHSIPNDPGAFGVASAFKLHESVFYVKDYFVVASEETIILSDNTTPTVKVGLKVSEQIVNYQDDETLLDPASGSYNYAAPGADRVQIVLDLIITRYDPVAESDAENMIEDTEDNFIELARYKSGVLVKSLVNPNLGALEDVLARRTFDESGNYTVRAFKAKAVNSVRRDPDLLTLAIEPGKAYVKGFEFETSSTVTIDLEKARTSESFDNYISEAGFGDYFIINHPTGGTLNYSANPTIQLRNTGNTQIGSAKVSYISHHSSTQLKLYVYDVVLTSGKLSDITNVFESPWTATVDAVNADKLYRAKKRDFLMPMGDTPIKMLSDVSYTSQLRISATATGTTITSPSLSSGKQYFSSQPGDYIVVAQSNGAIVTGFTVTPSSSSFILTGTFNNGSVYDVYATVAVNTPVVKSKTRTRTTIFLTNTTVTRLSLGVPDVYRIVSILASHSTNTQTPKLNVTARYSLDNGQRDFMYEYGALNLNRGQSPAPTGTYNRLEVTIEHFLTSQEAGYFSIDSYDTLSTDSALVVPYESIPTFVSSSGTRYPLRDCMDFRPRRAPITGYASSSLASPLNTVTPNAQIIGDEKPEPFSVVTADYDYYIPRVDKLVITKEKRFDLIKGIPAKSPQNPSDLPDAMTIYSIEVPAYTFNPNDVKLNYVENKRYTMRDIGKIDTRVSRLEYYTAMSLLEKQAGDESVSDGAGIEKFKNGILVDPFRGFGVADVGSSEFSASIDSLTRTLRPRFSKQNVLFDLNRQETASSNYAINNGIVTLPFSTEVTVSNTQATNWVNLFPYLVFDWNGEVKLSPSSDTWSDTTTRPDLVVNVNGDNDAFTVLANDVTNPASTGVKWADWQLVDKGVDIKTNVSSVDNVTYALQSGRAIETTQTTTTKTTTTTVNDTFNRSGLEIERSDISTVTKDMGTKVVDASLVPFIRSRVVDFSGMKLKPNTELFASFDGVDVTRFCNQAPVIFVPTVPRATRVRKAGTSKAADIILLRTDRAFIKMDKGETLFTAGDIVEWFVNGSWVSGTSISESLAPSNDSLVTDESGDIAGYFLIPNTETVRFRVGERVFRLADSLGVQPTTAAESKYVALGMAMSLQKDVISTRVQTVAINPISSSQTITTVNVDKDVSVAYAQRDVTIRCGETQAGSGNAGRFVYDLDFGTDIGQCGINYDPTGIPDRYTIVWNGQTYTTGFRGAASYNSALISRGFPSVTTSIDSNNPSAGKLRFNKTAIFPNKARLIVDAPIPGTRWMYKAICPGKIDNLLPEADPRIDVVIDMPASVNLTMNQNNNSVTGNVFNFTVRPVGVMNVPPGTPIRINSIAIGEVRTNGLWASFSSFVIRRNGAVVSFPLTVGAGETLTFQLTAGVTGNALTNGTTVFNTRQAPIVRATVSCQLVTAIDGTIASASSFDQTLVSSTVIQRVVIQARRGGRDPIAQTFFVSSRENPDGIFINAVDVYFKSKDPSGNLAVSLEIRPTVNGYPDSERVLPMGTATVMSRDIQLSAPEDATKKATKFTLDAPVYLAPDTEYAIVVIAPTDQFEAYISRLGEFLLHNPNIRSTQQPLLGSFFISQNSTTWTAEQTDDMLFRLHKCVFPVNSTRDVILNTTLDVEQTSSGRFDYDLLFVDGEVLDFSSTNVDYFVRPSKVSGASFAKDSAWTAYQLGSNLTLPERKAINPADTTTLRVRCSLRSSNQDVSPVIDLERLGGSLVQNVINNNINSETIESVITIVSAYATTSEVFINTSGAHGFSVGDQVYISADVNNEFNGLVEVTGVVSSTQFKYNRTDGGAAVGSVGTPQTQDGTAIRQGQALSKYVTRKVTLNSAFYSSDIKVYFSANIPSECRVVPYYRVASLNDPILEDNAWVAMALDSASTPNRFGFTEYKYKPPFTLNDETVAMQSGDKYGMFAVKLVMTSSNPVKVPLVKDLRVLALDD